MVTGAWSAGDLHVHTIQSDDAQTTLETVLDQAFNRYKLDWAALSNHLRMSKRDHTGLDIPGGPVPFSTGMARYEAPFIQQAQAAAATPARSSSRRSSGTCPRMTTSTSASA